MNANDEEARRSRVSAVMDGQVDEAQLQRWLSEEARHAAVLDDWHTYHLIGDVMRSPDLATAPGRDARVLQGVRQALRDEHPGMPKVRLPAARGTRAPWRLWGAAAAAVAGTAVVLTAYLVTRADPVTWGTVVAAVTRPLDDIRRASLGPSSAADPSMPRSEGKNDAAPLSFPYGFREILRLPRGPAGKPQESIQVLYSNGSATISLTVEPFRPGEHLPRRESSDRLNTLTLQRQDNWLTLAGDVPMGTLQQVALSLPTQP